MAKTEEELAQLEKQIDILLLKLQDLGVSIDTTGMDNLNTALQQANDQLISNLTLNEKQIQQASSAVDIQLELNESLFKAGKITKEQYGDNQKRLGQEQKKVDLLSEEEKLAKDALKTSLGITANSGVYGKKLQEISNLSKLNLSQEERKELILRLQAKVLDSIAQAAQFLFNQALQIDNSARSLMKSAGFTYEDASSGIMEAGLNAAAAGVPIGKFTEAMTTLKTTFTGYTELTKQQARELDSLVAVMDNMGLSAATQSKFMDTATKSMGMSTKQTMNFISSLKGFSDKSGISLQELDKNLSSSMAKLANFGREGIKVFQEMSLVSKQLGIEVGALFDIAERFTTFEGAAEAAGKFNALLGGPFVNSVDLLTMSLENPTEAFKVFKNAMDQSGKSFADMDVGMKKTMATALGMTVQQAGSYFAKDINTATRAMREQAATQEKLNKMSGEMASLQDKFKAALAALYPVLKPIIESIAKVGDKFTEYAVAVSKFMKEHPALITGLRGIAIAFFGISAVVAVIGSVMLPVITLLMSFKALGMGMVGIYKALQFIKAPLVGITKLMALAKGEEAAATAADTAAKGANIPVTSAAGGAAKGAAAGMLAMGAAILLIGVGIGIAAYGLSFLVASFKDLGTAAWPATIAVIGFTLAIGGLIFVLASMNSGPQAALVWAGIGILLAIGAAAMMIGKGIEMAVASMALYVNAQANLNKSIAGGADSIKALKDSLTENEFKKFDTLNEKFATLASHMKDIKQSNVLSELTKISVPGPEKQPTTELTKTSDALTATSSSLMMLSAAIALHDAQVSLNKSVADGVDSIKVLGDSLTESQFEKFDTLNQKFATLASHMKDIRGSNVLSELTKISAPGPAKQSTAVPTLKSATASGGGAGGAEAGKTSVAGDGNKIEIHLKIDSPIMLENREVGRFVDNKIETVLTSLRTPQMSLK